MKRVIKSIIGNIVALFTFLCVKREYVVSDNWYNPKVGDRVFVRITRQKVRIYSPIPYILALVEIPFAVLMRGLPDVIDDMRDIFAKEGGAGFGLGSAEYTVAKQSKYWKIKYYEWFIVYSF